MENGVRNSYHELSMRNTHPLPGIAALTTGSSNSEEFGTEQRVAREGEDWGLIIDKGGIV